jgi:hypothetical protein
MLKNIVIKNNRLLAELGENSPNLANFQGA